MSPLLEKELNIGAMLQRRCTDKMGRAADEEEREAARRWLVYINERVFDLDELGQENQPSSEDHPS